MKISIEMLEILFININMLSLYTVTNIDLEKALLLNESFQRKCALVTIRKIVSHERKKEKKKPRNAKG